MQRISVYLFLAMSTAPMLKASDAHCSRGISHTRSILSSPQNMKLLNDGRLMPVFGLGVFQSKKGDETCNAVLTALRLGYRHVDTAQLYRNEEDVGRAVSQFIAESGVTRDEIWVTTKLWPKAGFRESKKSLEESIQRLNMDYVDLVLIHSPNDRKNRMDQWRALIEFQAEGKARSIGVSNYGIHHLEELFQQSDVKPSINQIELSPFLPRDDLVKFCEDHNIAVEAYSPLTKAVRLTDPRVLSMASKYDVTAAQLLIQWCLQKGFITIPKSVSPSRIEENSLTLSRFPNSFALGSKNELSRKKQKTETLTVEASSTGDAHVTDGDETTVITCAIEDDDMRDMASWNEGLVTGWDPTVAP